jgi:hypothetical protein
MGSTPTRKDLSQYDGQETLRSAHEDKNQSFRVTSGNTSVPPGYSRSDITYNVDGSVENAKFYEGITAEMRQIKVTKDTAGSLNNTYFTLYDTNDAALYHIWFNVSGGGTDPAPANSIGIEVPIETNDPASIVALALELAIKKLSCFITRRINTDIYIDNVRLGVCTDTADNGTGFNFIALQQGAERLMKSIDITQIPGAKYIYNEEERKFEIENTGGGTVDPETGASIVVIAPKSNIDYGLVSVTNTATPLYIGGSNLDGRREITIQPKGGTIYVGYDNTVTAGKGGTGIRVNSNSVLTISVDDSITVYGIKSGGGSVNTHVSEGK